MVYLIDMASIAKITRGFLYFAPLWRRAPLIVPGLGEPGVKRGMPGLIKLVSLGDCGMRKGGGVCLIALHYNLIESWDGEIILLKYLGIYRI